jgi:hypothetical protein
MTIDEMRIAYINPKVIDKYRERIKELYTFQTKILTAFMDTGGGHELHALNYALYKKIAKILEEEGLIDE